MIKKNIYFFFILLVITIGFVYELGKGALKIDSKQNIGPSNDSRPNTSISFIPPSEGTSKSPLRRRDREIENSNTRN